MSKIKVAAVGFRGILILEELLKMNLQNIDYVVVERLNLDAERSSAKIKIVANEDEHIYALDGGSPQRSEEFAINHKDEIFSALDGAEFVLIIMDIGDNDGEGIPPVIADIAKEIGALTIFVVFVPFNMSPYREKNARECLTKLNDRAVFVMELEAFYLAKLVPPKTKFYEGYMLMMKFAAQDVKNILDCYVSKSFALST